GGEIDTETSVQKPTRETQASVVPVTRSGSLAVSAFSPFSPARTSSGSSHDVPQPTHDQRPETVKPAAPHIRHASQRRPRRL
ncbi:TPA: hypothetical protein ACW2VG_007303, partial [Burkholderia stabilis]